MKHILDEQAAYYVARAPEYDDWWERKGRYDRGPDETAAWRREIEDVVHALEGFGPRGRVVELAAGTGWWTERLAKAARELTCVDASAEVLALNRARIERAHLPPPTYVRRDIFGWAPDGAYDCAFFSFWLSHVPDDHFERFWAIVGDAVGRSGRVFFIDSRREQTSTAHNQTVATDGEIQRRQLNDGRAYNIVKIYYEPATLSARLASLGWRADIRTTDRYFIYGSARKTT